MEILKLKIGLPHNLAFSLLVSLESLQVNKCSYKWHLHPNIHCSNIYHQPPLQAPTEFMVRDVQINVVKISVCIQHAHTHTQYIHTEIRPTNQQACKVPFPMTWMIISDHPVVVISLRYRSQTEGPTPYENSYVQESKNRNQWAHLQTEFSKLQGWD